MAYHDHRGSKSEVSLLKQRFKQAMSDYPNVGTDHTIVMCYSDRKAVLDGLYTKTDIQPVYVAYIVDYNDLASIKEDFANKMPDVCFISEDGCIDKLGLTLYEQALLTEYSLNMIAQRKFKFAIQITKA